MNDQHPITVISCDQMDSLWAYANPLRAARNLLQRRHLMRQFVLREVQLRYRGSYMGLLWAMISPLLSLAVYTFIFTVIARVPWPDAPNDTILWKALMIFSGLIAYGVFSECVSRAPGLILSNPNYVKKVVFPLELLPVTILGSALIHSLISLGIVVVGMIACTHSLHWTLLLLPLAYLPLVLLSLGLGWMLASLGVFVRDIGNITGVVLQLLLFLTPITYPMSAVPRRILPIMRLNPLATIVDTFRRLIGEGRLPDWQAWSIVTAVAMLVAMGGYMWFMKMKRALADVI